MIEKLLNKNLVQFSENEKNWEEAIYNAALPLIQNKSIEPSYIDKIILNTHEIGPYYVLGPKIALPHARPEFGVNKMGLSVLVVKEPVWFSEEERHKVHLIIVLAAVDNNSHLEALSELASVLGDDSKVEQLIQTKSAEEFLNLLFSFIH